MKENIHILIAMLESRKVPYRVVKGELYADVGMVTSIQINTTRDVVYAHEQIKRAMA